MAITNKYVKSVYNDLKKRYKTQPEFLEAAGVVLETIEPIVAANEELYKKNAILERIVEPERTIMFRVTWMDDKGKVRVNRGYRVQFNSAIGPYKGGLRLHPSVNLSILKFLGFEQVFKNSLTTLPMGGGKGGSDFDPKGKSDAEVMRFCQSFMTELVKHVGPDTDVPAGDIGTGAREIGYMYGQYKRLMNEHTGVLTGKNLLVGGSLARKEATGYGLCYCVDAMLRDNKKSFKGKTVVVSGSGNVAIYATEKATELGAKVVALSDSNGYVYDPEGIDLDLVKQIKEQERGRIKEYADRCKHKGVKYHPSTEKDYSIWSVKCDIALPCATQNEIKASDAELLAKNGCFAVGEGANMPSVPEAIEIYHNKGILFIPGKASNAGGVAVSGLEMSQNSERLSWSFEEVDAKLKGIMENIYANVASYAKKYDVKTPAGKYNLVAGANMAGFDKVAQAMIWEGVAY